MSIDISWNAFELALPGVGGAQLAAAALLSVVARGPRATCVVADGDRDVYELAALHGGAPCAVMAAAARLHAAGCLVVRGGSIGTSWRLEGEVAPLERELYETIDLQPGMSADAIRGALRRGPAYARVVASAREAGLAPAPIVAATSLIRGAKPATRLGLAVLESHRDRVRHLAGGPVADRDLALAVALFGSEPLRATHPEFAAAWGIPSSDEVRLQAAILG